MARIPFVTGNFVDPKFTKSGIEQRLRQHFVQMKALKATSDQGASNLAYIADPRCAGRATALWVAGYTEAFSPPCVDAFSYRRWSAQPKLAAQSSRVDADIFPTHGGIAAGKGESRRPEGMVPGINFCGRTASGRGNAASETPFMEGFSQTGFHAYSRPSVRAMQTEMAMYCYGITGLDASV